MPRRKPPSIFISYIEEDNAKAERLRTELISNGFGVWKDTHELLPGQPWELTIKQALENNDFVILCFSKEAVQKTGYFQVEVKEALHWQKYRPDSRVYIIPVRFDECNVPYGIDPIQYVDLFPRWKSGIDKIVATIRTQRP